MMRTILFIVLSAFWAVACTSNIGQPPSTGQAPVLPESVGNQPNSDFQGSAFSITTEAFYQASVPSSSTTGKLISLKLTPGGSALMTTDYLDRTTETVDTGSWTVNNRNLLLHLHRIGQKDSMMLEFKTDGDKLVYTGVEFGSEGLTLWSKPLPVSNPK